MNVWGSSRPSPPGWVLCRTYEKIILKLETGQVEDLVIQEKYGPCDFCSRSMSPKDAYVRCTHAPTGESLVVMMHTSGIWPKGNIFFDGRHPSKIEAILVKSGRSLGDPEVAGLHDSRAG